MKITHALLLAAALNPNPLAGQPVAQAPFFDGGLPGTFHPEALAVPKVAGAAVVRITAEVKILAALDRMPGQMDRGLDVLRRKYGFICDRQSAPQVVANDKEFTILPYPSGPRPIVYAVKGFITENRVADLSRDPSVRSVRADEISEPLPDMEAFLVEFIERFGAVISGVPGVGAVAVGTDCAAKEKHHHILPHKPALVITLDGSVKQAEVSRSLNERLPALSVIPHRFETMPEASAEPEKRFRTQY